MSASRFTASSFDTGHYTKLYTEQQVRALLATATGLPAQAVYAIDPVQAAADAASVGHLSHLVDHQTVLLSRAMAVMKAVELTASPIDESDGDLDARIPYEAWSTFVDARAALLHAVAQSPVAAPQAQADARDAERYRWLFGARTKEQVVSVSGTVGNPLPQDHVLNELQCFYTHKELVDEIIDAAEAAQQTQGSSDAGSLD